MGETTAQESSAEIRRTALAVRAAGGRALLVGGSVRDRLLERTERDLDLEVLGLDLETLESILAEFGRVHRVGRNFEVLKVSGIDIDFSVAERADFDFAQAAKRRDLTINSMALDPLTDELLDPYSGQTDLEQGILRATDPSRFGDDPLRALRVARLAAELEMQPEQALVRLCEEQDLAMVPPERIFAELSKLLLDAPCPSRGLKCLEETRVLRFLPELDALRETPQDPEWHPEGDVWTHTTLSMDCAAKMRQGDPGDLPLMWGVLCHDLGKPASTKRERGRIRSLGHDRKGEEISRQFLSRLRAPAALSEQVAALVRHHLAPAVYVAEEAGPRGYRRLARRLDRSGVNLSLLERVARADHLGRNTADAQEGVFPAGEIFLQRAVAASVDHRPVPDAVQGRHLIARGLQPGREFGEILERCRSLQDEGNETDPEVILNQILGRESTGR